jgi:hypothetical protein
LQNADHLLGGFGHKGADHPHQMQAVRALTLAFLDGNVADNTQARDWLSGVEDHIGAAHLLFKRK